MSTTTATTTTHDLTALLDRAAIETVVHRLGRCLDEREFDGLRDVLTTDVEVQTPGGTSRGHDAAVEQARHRHEGPRGLQHVVTNLLTELDGDEATVRANLLVTFAENGVDDPAPFVIGEVYRFALRREADGWRIARLTTEPVWTLNRPAAGLVPNGSR